ncbi:MAG: hypothetical protein DRQ54_09875 [Gammaproteobacteria bacterium]|nr:MAG: hypothetical protein DRQ54_09875 [Gammaproteobacteria bacterium]
MQVPSVVSEFLSEIAVLGVSRTRAVALSVPCLIVMWPFGAMAWVSTVGCSGPPTCSLAELFAGGSIVVDTKIFADWELVSIESDGVVPDYTQILVEGLDDGGLDPGNGLRFSGNGELAISGEDVLELELGFSVTEFQSTRDIVGSTLTTVSDTATGRAIVSIAEFVSGAVGAGQGDNEISNDPFFAPAEVTDSIEFPVAQKTIMVTEEILIEGRDPADSASLDVFEQRFSQVPEPRLGTAIAVGSLALAFCHWHSHFRRRDRHRGRISAVAGAGSTNSHLDGRVNG